MPGGTKTHTDAVPCRLLASYAKSFKVQTLVYPNANFPRLDFKMLKVEVPQNIQDGHGVMLSPHVLSKRWVGGGAG